MRFVTVTWYVSRPRAHTTRLRRTRPEHPEHFSSFGFTVNRDPVQRRYWHAVKVKVDQNITVATLDTLRLLPSCMTVLMAAKPEGHDLNRAERFRHGDGARARSVYAELL